jgi:hypothetical protein
VDLEAALTCFPATETLTMKIKGPLDPAEETRLVELLRGHGATLKRVEGRGKGGGQLLLSAVRAGALPSLTYFYFCPLQPIHREILSGGMLSLLEEVLVCCDTEEQVAALEHLRRLPHLRCLKLVCEKDLVEAAFPPFIPPSLRRLHIDINHAALLESLLRELPSMLQASGARVEEIELPSPEELSPECGPALTQVLRACSSTLKTVKLTDDGQEILGAECFRESVPGLASICETLEVLHWPWAAFSALLAACPSFPRLTKLRLWAGRDEDIDLASTAWDMVANGRLPALVKLALHTRCDFTRGGHLEGAEAIEGVRRLSRAFEAVAGTLKLLFLTGTLPEVLPARVAYEIGAAIGKLRRLRFLHLDLLSDGEDCSAVGRGMAASGGCPELFRVWVRRVDGNLDYLTYEPSLIGPSVRSLGFADCFGTEDEALLLCCGLVQMGYKHHLRMLELMATAEEYLHPSVEACMRAILCGGGMNVDMP